jgi:hypothetical protein
MRQEKNQEKCPTCGAARPQSKEHRILLARKPCDLEDIWDQVTGELDQEDIKAILQRTKGKKEVKELTVISWRELAKTDLKASQFWKVLLQTEDTMLFIDTQGYDYARYAGICMRPSKHLRMEDKLDHYEEEWKIHMNDLSKDELIDQLWDAKPKEEKEKEAEESARSLDW